MDQTRFTPDLNVEGLSPEDAFGILGNEIRLEIIRILWRADAAHEYDDGSDTADTMSYSGLRREVGIEDNGKFNYHLSELAPHFIRRTDEGYRLSGAGKQIARTVIAVSGPDELDFSSELNQACPLCAGPVKVTYEDQWLRVRCEECNGLFGDQAPTGTLFLTKYPAAGLRDRTSKEALAAGLYRCVLDITYMMYGICRECAGQITASVTVCDTHERPDDRSCVSCGTPFPVWAEMECDTCGFAKRLPVEMFATGLGMTTGAIYSQELDIHAPSFDQTIDMLQTSVETTVSEDPFRVTVRIQGETSTTSIQFDREMNIVDMEDDHDSRQRNRGSNRFA